MKYLFSRIRISRQAEREFASPGFRPVSQVCKYGVAELRGWRQFITILNVVSFDEEAARRNRTLLVLCEINFAILETKRFKITARQLLWMQQLVNLAHMTTFESDWDGVLLLGNCWKAENGPGLSGT